MVSSVCLIYYGALISIHTCHIISIYFFLNENLAYILGKVHRIILFFFLIVACLIFL